MPLRERPRPALAAALLLLALAAAAAPLAGQAVHPRLLFGPDYLPVLREKVTRAPFDAMLASLVADAETGEYRSYAGPTPANPSSTADPYGQSVNAFRCAFLYAATGDDAWAAKARFYVNLRITDTTVNPWASSSLKGLNSYWQARHVALAYDLAHGAPSWDAAFTALVSAKLKEIADMVATNGGTEQNTNSASNWQGLRGASAGLAYLACDETYSASNYSSAYTRARNYLRDNLGTGATSRGWNIEGVGYLGYPYGAVAPFMVAAKRANPADDLFAATPATQWMMWAQYAATIRLSRPGAPKPAGRGGDVWLVHPDFGDDNATADDANGMYGFAFLHTPAALHGALKWWYNRLLIPEGNWDFTRAGTIYSILYYPDDVAEEDPLANTTWRSGFDDRGGNGFFTWRNAYRDEQDAVAQLYVKLRGNKGHAGPDALSFRILGQNTAWAVGGGRYGTQVNGTDAYHRSQNTLYPVDPQNGALSISSGSGSVVAAPLVKENGGGHLVSQIGLNNVGTSGQKRWFAADHGAAGVDAVYVIGDTSHNGFFWQLNTLDENSFEPGPAANQFTVRGMGGATLRGTVVYPAITPEFVTGNRPRGSHWAYGLYGTSNNYLHFSGPGDYLVVLTAARAGQTHPTVTGLGGRVQGASVQVGAKTYTLTNDGVLYDNPQPVGAAPAPIAWMQARGHPFFAEAEVRWTPAEGADGYLVWRSEDAGGTWRPAAKILNPAQTSFLDPKLPPGADFRYRVQAYNAAADSPFSGDSTARIGASGATGVIAYESFEDVSAGSLSGAGSGNGWAGPWGNAGAQVVDVSANPLAAAGVSGGDRAVSLAWGDECGRRLLASAPATNTADGVWLSYLMRVETAAYSNSLRAWAFTTSGNYDWGFLGLSGNGTSDFRLSRNYNNGTNGGGVWQPQQTYLLVAHVGSSGMRLWVNPASEADTPAVTRTDRWNGLTGLGLSSRSVGPGVAILMDRFVVGRSFADVIAGPPAELSSAARLAAHSAIPEDRRAPLFDHDGDGRPNILEDLQGLDPTVREAHAAAWELLPDLAAGDLCFRFRVRKGLPAGALTVETRTDPALGWTAVTAVPTVVADEPSAQVLEVRFPAGAAEPLRLVRLRAAW